MNSKKQITAAVETITSEMLKHARTEVRIQLNICHALKKQTCKFADKKFVSEPVC
jgi:hypothetical protein